MKNVIERENATELMETAMGILNPIIDEINDCGMRANAISYYGGGNESYCDFEITFNRDQLKNYKKLIEKAVDNGGIVMSTHPGTLGTTIRFMKAYIKR